MKDFQIIVVGGGHAGTEAALATSRMGIKTLLITHNVETLGQLSCNPSIGGIGKSQIVKEIDALGGVMALAADSAGIQFRVLNGSKGVAVRSTRAQVDRILYKSYIRNALENQENLSIFQQSVDDLLIENNSIAGVVCQGNITIKAECVILSNGTFLSGKIHLGLKNYSGGRAGEAASTLLSEQLSSYNFAMGRLKTGTPPRIDGRTIDFTKLLAQYSDTPVPVFSIYGNGTHPQQIPCFITRTNEKTHEIIRENIANSPLFNGNIEGIGPRYCPSIEDKVYRFDKNSHQIFLEPEGLTTNEYYPNGISTSLPFDVQYELVQSIYGLENAHIIRPGYAIEYDYFDPTALKSSLESKMVNGLFFAGQINGTTGYEEAGGQGIIAGINAGLKIQGQESWCPARNEAYIGVMIDDLITKGVMEPYRMFSSRAEYRLQLREDNAYLRLSDSAYKFGLINQEQFNRYLSKSEQIANELARLKTIFYYGGAEINDNILEHEYSCYELLKRPDVSYKTLTLISDSNTANILNADIKSQVEIQIKYAGYIARQVEDVNKMKKLDSLRLPINLDYSKLTGLSTETIERLSKFLPESIGHASRIYGITPAAISLLMVYHKKGFSLND